MANARQAAEQTSAPINEKSGSTTTINSGSAGGDGISEARMIEITDGITERINNLEAYLSARISALENS